MNDNRLTKSALSKRIKRSSKVIDDWIAKGLPCERSDRGRYFFDLGEVFIWREKDWESRNVSSGDAETKAKLRKMEADAGLSETELERRRGELVELSKVEEAIARDYATVRTRMRAIPHKLAPIIATESDPVVCRELLEESIDDGLAELANGNDIADGRGATGGKKSTRRAPKRARKAKTAA